MRPVIERTRLTGYNANPYGLLLPVEIPHVNGNTVQGQWNMRVRRWHRRAGR